MKDKKIELSSLCPELNIEDNFGKVVAVEPESMAYYMGDSITGAYQIAKEKHPGKTFQFMRIGKPFTLNLHKGIHTTPSDLDPETEEAIQKLLAELKEQGEEGKTVAIHVPTMNCYLGEDLLSAHETAVEAHPNETFLLCRVGKPFTIG